MLKKTQKDDDLFNKYFILKYEVENSVIQNKSL